MDATSSGLKRKSVGLLSALSSKVCIFDNMELAACTFGVLQPASSVSRHLQIGDCYTVVNGTLSQLFWEILLPSKKSIYTILLGSMVNQIRVYEISKSFCFQL